MNQIRDEILGIKWDDYETAYGSASNVSDYLLSLLIDDESEKLESCHQLWCSLCHQHAYVSSASLPAFSILLKLFEVSSEKIKVELMDIFVGFAECTNPKHPDAQNELNIALRKSLISNIAIWKELSYSQNEEIAAFSKDIIGLLQ